MNIFDLLVVQPIFNLLIALYSVVPGGDFGVSVIIFTIFVRFALYPLVKKQLHQTQAMRKLQPQLARIKAKSKGNKQQESMQMLELYKEHGINPFRAIGILLIQLPIFIALYSVIQVFTAHRDEVAKFTYGFLENIPAIRQLIDNPDQFNVMFLGFVDLTKTAFVDGRVDIFLVILALVAAFTQYFMGKQTMPQNESKKRLRDVMAEAAEGKQADQAEMNAIVMTKMMKIMPFFMFFIMINLPGAIALYYATSNIVAVIQQSFLLRKDTEELEDIAEEAPVVSTHKKATAKAREKTAKTAKTTPTITRITAKDSGKKTK